MMIQRPDYLKRLISWKDKQLIKILTGVRRCGKSTLFKLYQEHLFSSGVSDEQIINLNMEDPDNIELLDWKKLYDFIKTKLVKDKKNYVFIDEVQNVKDFQRAADGLFIKENVDLYLTGSNSHIQSGQWATMIAGRYIEIHVFPLSFKEYLSAYPYKESRQDIYQRYLENSSFPYALNFTLPENKWDLPQIKDYLGGIYNTIVLKDIVENKKIKEADRLERVSRYLADNIGNAMSVKKISDALSSDGLKIYPQTVENYLRAFKESYVFYRADRYDVKGKRLLKTQNKYYLSDLGLRYFLLGDRKIDNGRMLENVVYLELLRRNRNVYAGKVDVFQESKGASTSKEVDFVVEGDGGTQYYQVAQSVLDEKTLQRELSALEAVNDHNPKYLLTMDFLPSSSHNGIKQINVFDWLLGENS